VSFLRANWWLFAALAGFLGYAGPLPTWLMLLNLIFLWPLLRPLARALLRSGSGKEDDGASVPEPALAPAAGGKALFWVRIATSTALLFVWPPALAGQVLQFVGDRRAAPRAIADVPSYRRKTRYSLPFRTPAEGEWYVFNGGPDEQTSHSWDLVSQRYAYDFVVVGVALRRWREGTEGRKLADYLCYGEPVLAPADGVVVAVEDGIRDAPRPGTGWLDPFARHIAGNHVVIEHADEGEYSFLAHLAPGSISVGVGERVSRGQQVGRCGNSGNSTEPHLHFQVQDRADFFEAAGLPVTFDGVSVDGSGPGEDVYIVRGTKIEPVVY
jgi:murein DD-endopeptidase MepM/ murein hydrolase activator NlpD